MTSCLNDEETTPAGWKYANGNNMEDVKRIGINFATFFDWAALRFFLLLCYELRVLTTQKNDVIYVNDEIFHISRFSVFFFEAFRDFFRFDTFNEIYYMKTENKINFTVTVSWINDGSLRMQWTLSQRWFNFQLQFQCTILIYELLIIEGTNKHRLN